MPENNTNIFANNLQKASSDKNMQAEDTKKNHSAKPDNKNSDRNKRAKARLGRHQEMRTLSSGVGLEAICVIFC